MSKEKVEAATNRVARAIKNLVQTFEQDGGSLTEDQFEKVFAYLQLLVHSGKDQAKAARVISIGSANTFSLDMVVPPIKTTPVTRDRLVRDALNPKSSVDPLLSDVAFIEDDEVAFIDDESN